MATILDPAGGIIGDKTGAFKGNVFALQAADGFVEI